MLYRIEHRFTSIKKSIEQHESIPYGLDVKKR
jgi:hypothetical protein